jgi:6-phosphogluconolactonase (cycloisomerase 2 family)
MMRYRILGWLVATVSSALIAACVIPAAAQATGLYDSTDSNEIFPFSVDSGGTLTSVSCSPASACQTATNHVATGEVVSPNGRYLYVATKDIFGVGSSITAFAIGTGGALSPITCSGCATGAANFLATSPNGKFVYASEGGGVFPFAIRANGSLTAVPCQSCEGPEAPMMPAVTPNGKLLYVSDLATSSIDAFAIHSDGTLSAISCGPDCNVGSNPQGDGITPSGRFLYVTSGGSNKVFVFAIGATGALSPVSCAACSVTRPEDIAISPSGKYAYVTDDAGISAFTIGANGALTAIACPGDCSLDSDAGVGDAVTPDGKFVYATSDLGPIYPFVIGSDGALTQVSDCTACDVSEGSLLPENLVLTPNQSPPTASFTAASAAVGKASRFNAAASFASTGRTIATYGWNFGDGTTLANGGVAPTHVYRLPGTYRVSLAVTDNVGCSYYVLFTGQTASCNGGPRALKTITITVPGPPRCMLTAHSAVGKKSHAFEASVHCLQPARLALTAKVKVTPRPVHHKKGKAKTYNTGVQGSTTGGTVKLLALKLPKAAFTALEAHAHESVTLKLVASDAIGSKTVTGSVKALKLG